ncbi:MAG: DUF3011 domain-containing protein, partial [Chlorobia bacterium]|nr:DUF3011 domain-containing protein [Fimbriimonadaceae bacterium]
MVSTTLGIVAVGAYAYFDTRRITLDSDGGRREYRRVDHDGYVRLVKRLSDRPCVQGRSWGYDRTGVWVDDGCRAVFEVGRDDRGNNRDDRWNDRDDRWTKQNTFKLESDGNDYEAKRVDTRGGVRIVRQLSDKPCVYGRSWGYDRDKVWVDRGCRAVFEVGSGRGNGYDRPNQNRYPDWLPGRYSGYEDGREFILNIDLDGRVALRRHNNGRWGNDEYGT